MLNSNPVVLLHGMGDTSILFNRLREFLSEKGRVTCAFDLVPSNGDAGLDELARQAGAYIAGKFDRRETLDLVGFSMGGLVARYYLQRLGGLGRVSRMVTIATPHRGTWTAFLRSNSGARQMRPGSAFLRDLERDRHVLGRIRFTTIWTPWDLMIVPAASSVIPEARQVRIGVPSHPRMVTDGRVLRAVERSLSE